MRKFFGNALSQYGIIIALVALALIPVLALTGQSIVQYFQEFSNTISKEEPLISKVTTSNTGTTTSTGTGTSTSTSVAPNVSIGDLTIKNNPDNTVSINIGGQTTTVSAGDYKIAEETMGVNGKDELMKEIAYLVEQNKANYPDGQLPPIDIQYGSGDRSKNMEKLIGAVKKATSVKGKYISEVDLEPEIITQTGTYSGEANAVNTTTIKVGDTYVIRQTDKSCKGTCTKAEIGDYRIEGKLDSVTNKFSGAVTSNTGLSGTYTATLVTGKDGKSYLSGYFVPDKKTTKTVSGVVKTISTDYQWDFAFNP